MALLSRSSFGRDGACPPRGNGGEVQVGIPGEMVYVDGYDETTHTIFEFYDCNCHGCPRCFKRQRDVRRNCHADRTVYEVYEATERKATMLRLCGYHAVEKWECEFQEEKKTDPALKVFLDNLDMVLPLDPRDAFYGGRTGAVSLYAKAEEGENIKYCDVTSLYPWVNKYKEYPVRFQLIFTNPSDQEIDHYFGLAQVDILAPLLCLCFRRTAKALTGGLGRLLEM